MTTHSLGIRLGSGLFENLLSGFHLVCLGSELGSSQKDRLGIFVLFKGVRENSLSTRNVSSEPFLLGSHEPQYLGIGTVFCSLEQDILYRLSIQSATIPHS
jgi:hypothetical protein